MAFKIDPKQIDFSKCQPILTPLAIFLGCVVIAAAIYGSGGITIGRKESSGSGESEFPAMVGEEQMTVTPSYDAAILERFAKCLTEKGATLYSASTCGYCGRQKALFGDALQYLSREVECYDEAAGGGWSKECQDAGIAYVPTWIFGDGTRLEGLQTLENIAAKTGCSLE